MKKGLLLINLGTPRSSHPLQVLRYLREFLMDRWVIDVPWFLRALLVYVLILPFRFLKSAHAYQQIWTKRGSPLMFHTEDLTKGVRARLGGEWAVAMAMRYQEPSIAKGLRELAKAGCQEIVLLPLYPQESGASTQTALEEVARAARSTLPPETVLKSVPAFYDHPAFIKAAAQVAKESGQLEGVDFVLMSFHGLPERQIQKADQTRTHCLFDKSCCAKISEVNKHCYRAQSFATARALAQELGLPADKWSVSFQSRLGRARWIEPYTDNVYKQMARKGVKTAAVFCPSFVADCLETLEEIAIRGREEYQAYSGGQCDLRAIPCVNSHPAWVEGVCTLAKEAIT